MSDAKLNALADAVGEDWASAVGKGLVSEPPPPSLLFKDVHPEIDTLLEEVAAAGPIPENFTKAYESYREDMTRASDQFESIAESDAAYRQHHYSTAQWVILAVTHLPLLVLWMYAVLGAFERASMAVRWVSRACGGADRSSSDDCNGVDDDYDDEFSETRTLVGEYQQQNRRPSQRNLPEQLPYVCVQLPMYNEVAVARRAIDAACLLRWPRDLLEIQVLDDSTDERCSAIIDAAAKTWRERGLMCNVVRRSHRRGYKAGALEAGRKKTPADLICVFDSDCIPPADYLERVVPHFYKEDGAMVPDLAMVQARWGFLNYDDGVLTMAQSLRLEAHRAAASAVLSRSVGCVVAAGAGATWSSRAITAAGGWDATTLLESTDLALRAYCAGYFSRFLPNTVVMTELPGTFATYRGQQERWAQGWAQMVKRHAWDLLDLHGRPLWQRWYLLAAVLRESMWPVTLLWMLLLPVLIARGEGWWLGSDVGAGGGGVMPRQLALLVYGVPPALLLAADALSAASLPPAPPLLMKHGQAAAVRLSWLVPYVVVQTGMVVVHASSFVMGMCSPRLDFSRTPKDGSGGYYTRETRYDGGGGGGGGGEPSVRSPTLRAVRGGHPFEVQNLARRGGGVGGLPPMTSRVSNTPLTPPPKPPRQQQEQQDQDQERGEVADPGEYATPGPGQSGVELRAIEGGGAGPALNAPENPGSNRRRMTTLVMEVALIFALMRLSFAVAAVDGWHAPAILCVSVASCIAFVILHSWEDTYLYTSILGALSTSSRKSKSWQRLSPQRAPEESLLGCSSKEGYGGLDGGAGKMRGGEFATHVSSRGVYDRASGSAPTQVVVVGRSGGGGEGGGRGAGGGRSGGVGGNAFWSASSPNDSPNDPQTRAAIKQYKRYRAKEFDLDNISVRSGDSNAYSDGVSAFGGRGGRFGSVLGSEWGDGSEAGSELASELSHSVFADAPPVLLTAAQLQHHYAAAAGSGHGPGEEQRGKQRGDGPEDGGGEGTHSAVPEEEEEEAEEKEEVVAAAVAAAAGAVDTLESGGEMEDETRD